MSLIVNFLTSPQAADFVQNSTCQVLSEGCLKAVGRPTFTLLDKTATTEELGKPVGSDEENQKSTFISHYGVDECEKIVIEKTEEAKKALNEVFANSEFLCWLADSLAQRRY